MIMTACDVLLVFNSNQRSVCLRYGVLTTYVFQGRGRYGHSGGHSDHADRWVRLSAWRILLVFYNNNMPETHRFCSTGMEQTDRQTDRRTDASLNALKSSGRGAQ